MKTKWISKKIKYDGSQLAGQYAYLEHLVLGPSIIAFRGPCDISTQHMADGEDLLAGDEIRGDDMIHFLVEVFEWQMAGAVALQRLLASIVLEEIQSMGHLKGLKSKRSGDDVYVGAGKLSISVAAKTQMGVAIHLAVNVTNRGTPVQTACLKDLDISAEAFAKKVLKRFQSEYASLIDATFKVRPVHTWIPKITKPRKSR